MKNNHLIILVAIAAFLLGCICGYAFYARGAENDVQSVIQNYTDKHIEETAKFFGASPEDAKKIARGENVEFNREKSTQKKDRSNDKPW